MKHELAKGQVIETITDILIDVVGWIGRDEISPDKDFVQDMQIVDDDIDAFGMVVMKHFGLKLKSGEYYRIDTIEQTAELVIRHSKDRVIEEIIDILIDVVGWVERDDISPDKDFVRDMHSVDGDLRVFDMELVRHFGIRPTFEAWYQTGTIEKVADLVIEQLLQADDSENRLQESVPADSSSEKRPALKARLGRLLAWFASWVVGLGILVALLAYTDCPLILITMPVALWLFVAWLLIPRLR